MRKKQDDMRHELQTTDPKICSKVKFYIGNVRNPLAVHDAMVGVDYIFHAAALKQVPSCEFFLWRQYKQMLKVQIMFFMPL